MRAAPLGLRDGDRECLEGWLRSSRIQAGLARRARIVLLAADGLSRATSKGPPFCHKLGTTSAVVGRVLIFV
jgi:hypothetical protein